MVVSTLDAAIAASASLSFTETVPALVVGIVVASLASAMALVSFRRRDAD